MSTENPKHSDSPREKVSELPKMTIYIHRHPQSLLEAACVLYDKAAWRILEEAWMKLYKTLPLTDRKKIETIVELMSHRNEIRKLI